MTVLETWRRVDRWVVEHCPDLFASLGEPLAPEAGAEGVPLELLASLRVHDGQTGELALFEAHSLMSYARSVEVRQQLLALNAQFADEYRAVGSQYWSEAWFPFMQTGDGQILCIDAKTGGVLAFIHNQPDRPKVAPSLSAFLSSIADAMESGACKVTDIGVELREAKHALATAIWGSND